MKVETAEFDRLALDELDTVYRVARQLTRDSIRAEDLVQETYLRAVRSRQTFELQEHGIRPWLLRILYNLHCTRGQREGRQPTAMEPEQLLAAESPGPDRLPINLQSFEAMDERLKRAIDDLPEEYRSVLLMWAVEDLSYKEIADILQVPLGTVMSRLHRTRQRLTEDLADLARETRIIRE